MRLAHDIALTQTGRQLRDEVQSGGRALRLPGRTMSLERGQQRIPAILVDQSHPAQVAVQLSAAEEVCIDELVKHRRSEIRRSFDLLEGFRKRLWRYDPTQTQRRRENLARTTCVDDALRLEPMEGTNRVAIVAIFGIVVVLDH